MTAMTAKTAKTAKTATARNNPPEVRQRASAARRLLVSASVVAIVSSGMTLPVAGPVSMIRPAHANAAPDTVFGDLNPLPREALARHRGGFSVAGLTINVGVDIDTIIDGAFRVTTNYTVASGGRLTRLGTEVKSVGAAGDLMPNVSEVVRTTIQDTQVTVQDAVGRAQGAAATGGSPPAAPAGTPSHGPAPQASASQASASQASAPQASAPQASAPQASASSLPETAPPPGVAVPSEPAAATAGTAANTPREVAVVPGFAEGVATGTVSETDNLPSGAARAVADIVSRAAETAETAARAASGGGSGAPAGAKVSTAAPIASARAAPDSSVATVPGVETTVAVSRQAPPPPPAQPAPLPAGTAPVAEAVEASGLAEALDQARIIHRVGDGHLSVIENSLNDVSIRQTTAINVTVENFTRLQRATRMQRSMSAMARQVAISSLRR